MDVLAGALALAREEWGERDRRSPSSGSSCADDLPAIDLTLRHAAGL